MAELTIHTYTAAEGGLFVNSYLQDVEITTERRPDNARSAIRQRS